MILLIVEVFKLFKLPIITNVILAYQAAKEAAFIDQKRDLIPDFLTSKNLNTLIQILLTCDYRKFRHFAVQRRSDSQLNIIKYEWLIVIIWHLTLIFQIKITCELIKQSEIKQWHWWKINRDQCQTDCLCEYEKKVQWARRQDLSTQWWIL